MCGRVAQVSHSRVVYRWHPPAEGAPCLVLFETWVPRPPIPWALRRRSPHPHLQNVPFVDPHDSGLPRSSPQLPAPWIVPAVEAGYHHNPIVLHLEEYSVGEAPHPRPPAIPVDDGELQRMLR